MATIWPVAAMVGWAAEVAAFVVSTTACILWPVTISNSLAVEPHGEEGGVTRYCAPPEIDSTSPCSSITLILVTISYLACYMGAGRGRGWEGWCSAFLGLVAAGGGWGH